MTAPEIELHINMRLNVGLGMQQIVAAIVNLLPYIGSPKVLNVLTVVRSVAALRNV